MKLPTVGDIILYEDHPVKVLSLSVGDDELEWEGYCYGCSIEVTINPYSDNGWLPMTDIDIRTNELIPLGERLKHASPSSDR